MSALMLARTDATTWASSWARMLTTPLTLTFLPFFRQPVTTYSSGALDSLNQKSTQP